MTLPTEVHATHPMRRAQHETISRLEQDGSCQGGSVRSSVYVPRRQYDQVVKDLKPI